MDMSDNIRDIFNSLRERHEKSRQLVEQWKIHIDDVSSKIQDAEIEINMHDMRLKEVEQFFLDFQSGKNQDPIQLLENVRLVMQDNNNMISIAEDVKDILRKFYSLFN